MGEAVRCLVVIIVRIKDDRGDTGDVVACRDSGLIRYYSRLVPEHITFRYSSVRANVCQTEDLTGTSAFMMY